MFEFALSQHPLSSSPLPSSPLLSSPLLSSPLLSPSPLLRTTALKDNGNHGYTLHPRGQTMSVFFFFFSFTNFRLFPRTFAHMRCLHHHCHYCKARPRHGYHITPVHNTDMSATSQHFVPQPCPFLAHTPSSACPSLTCHTLVCPSPVPLSPTRPSPLQLALAPAPCATSTPHHAALHTVSPSFLKSCLITDTSPGPPTPPLQAQ